jgi:drug/metabolite transporter (DMT)-like permease
LSNQTSKLSSVQAWSLLLLLAFVWGASFILIKKSLGVFNSWQVGSLRIIAASVFLIPYAIINWKNIPKESHIYLFLSGMLGVFLPAFLFTLAGQNLPSAISGALNALTPLWVLLLGIVFFKNKIKQTQVIGIVIGFVGSMFLAFKGGINHLSLNYYALYVFAATICYGLNLNITKKYLSGIPALLQTSAFLCFIGPIALSVFLSTDMSVPRQATSSEFWMALGYVSFLGVVGTGAAMILFNYLLQNSSAVFASSVTYLIPVVAMFWGFIDGETIGFQELAGMCIILLAVYLITMPSGSKKI